ncbi:MAG TPA: PHB depolymerase family esterase [Pseudomonadota bacterium]|nr:PHB depolymerase family esterase [Pseudomonadota bacterium]HNO69857.1 PHB depolymerase family esterase [Pseudomonadota bacterium]
MRSSVRSDSSTTTSAPLADRFLAMTERDPESDESLPYRLLTPAASDAPTEKVPLVVFLHGAGERGDDNCAQLQHGVAEFLSADDRRSAYPCFYLVPQCPSGLRWVEVNWDAPQHQLPDSPSRPLQLLLRLIDRLARDPRIDSSRIYLLGLSMGGFGVWDLLCRRPQLVAAAVIICGGGDEQQAAKMAHIPQWVFHGAQDAVVSVSRSRNMVHALQKAGGQPRYVEYPMVAHDAWGPALREPELIPWLWRQTRTR